jgi:hypothetical protein
MSPRGLLSLLSPHLCRKLRDLKMPVVFSPLWELVLLVGQKGVRCHVSLPLQDEEHPSYVRLYA